MTLTLPLFHVRLPACGASKSLGEPFRFIYADCPLMLGLQTKLNTETGNILLCMQRRG
ncbi:hypothetical protein EDC32_101345 [Laceyella sacchari]|jgi:hypothetical protein|nr:hypothetical protein EDC32_101345 [Laceyella sacchari]